MWIFFKINNGGTIKRATRQNIITAFVTLENFSLRDDLKYK